MSKHKCKYEWFPYLAGEVFGCPVCKSITTPERAIVQLEAENEQLREALQAVIDDGSGFWWMPKSIDDALGGE